MRQELAESIRTAVRELFGISISVELSRPAVQFGDYSTNAALIVAAETTLKAREIAEKLAEKLRGDQSKILAAVDVAGPGFINLKLQDRALFTMVRTAIDKPYAGQTFIVEYSDPNPFKPLHAGHLYTTLVGDVITRLVEVGGANVIRINYSGDVGLHVAKSLWAIVKHLGGELAEKLADIPEQERSEWLGARYVEGNTAYEEDEGAKAEIIALNQQVYKIHQSNDHDSPLARIYWTARQWSYDYFRQLYQQLQVVPFDRFITEGEVTPLGLKTVREQLVKGVFTKSNGAIVFVGEPYGLHTRVFINSAGLPTYEAKEVGLSLTKWRDYHFDHSVIITANEQAQYMQVVLAAIQQFAPDIAGRTHHLTHGVVKLRGGVKMSSRQGNVVLAPDILKAAKKAGQASPTNPNADTVLAAVKYAFVKSRLGNDIIYDANEAIALEGNSGPYLQYAHARARSILANAARPRLARADRLQPDERALLLKLTEYPEVVGLSIQELMPHHLCTYLYELAQLFNYFYEHNRVVGDQREAVRLRLVKTYADTLKKGLTLLGIIAPNRL